MTADFRMALLELLRQYQGEPEVDALREGLRWLAQQLMGFHPDQQIGRPVNPPPQALRFIWGRGPKADVLTEA